MKFKQGQKVRVKEGVNPATFIVQGQPGSLDYLVTNVIEIRTCIQDHPTWGNIYEFLLPSDRQTFWMREEALRALKAKSKDKPLKQLSEVEQLDQIALNFREG